jgi:phosphoglycerol transferase MdoB-like AlkP superfamily enzyme
VLICLVSPLALLPRKVWGAALVAFDLALSVLILTDLVLLRYFSDLFSFRNIGLAGYASDVSDSAVALMRLQDSKYFADLPFLVLLLAAFFRREGGKGGYPRRAAAAIAIFILGASGVVWKIHDYDGAVPGAIRSLWDRPAVAISVGSLVYHAADVMNIAEETLARKNYSALDEKKLTDWLEARAGSVAVSPMFGAARGKNLIMIQTESLQSFVVGLRVGGAEVAPNVSRLARESLLFTRAFNQTASGNSSDAELMANASLYPSPKGVAFARFAGNAYNSLGTELKKLGYSTAAFHGDKPGFWNRNHMYPALGFDRYISKREFEPGEGVGLGLSDRDFFDQSLRRIVQIRDEGRPFYAFLVTLTSHYPFNFGALKKQAGDLNLGALEDSLPGAYLRSICYADEQIGNFLRGLESEGILDESVIAIYGDHPAIPRGDAATLEVILGRDLSSLAAWREIQSVAFMIRLPRKEMAQAIDIPTGQMDIAPTVASLLGFSIPTAFGCDLLDPALNRDEKLVIFRNGSFVKGDVWVQPGEKRAFDLPSRERLSYSDEHESYAAAAASVLELSDMLLEGDMARKVVLRREKQP